MPKKKEQHYVPVFYLKRFSPDGRSIGLWNIQAKKKVLSASLKNQCREKFFFGEDESVENSLSDLESPVSKILRYIDRDSSLPPRWHRNYKILSKYTFTQLLRTKCMTEQINSMLDQVESTVTQNNPHKLHINGHTEEEFEKIVEEFKEKTPEFSVVDVSYSDRTKWATSDLASKLLINKTKVEFITSDHPVVLYNQLLNFMSSFGIPGSRTGLIAKGLQVFFPISPTELLLFYDPTSYQVGYGHRRNVIIRHKQEVLDINVLQMYSANENIYFKNETFDFDTLYNRSELYKKRMQNDFNMQNFNVQRERERGIILMHGPRPDVNTDLKLSFIRIMQEAKLYQTNLKKKIEAGHSIPAILPRESLVT